jgi:GNAT superfamily N-acetyltransferase
MTSTSRPRAADPTARRDPAPPEELRIERWDTARSTARLDDVMDVYRAAFLDLHEADPVRARAERKAYATRHLTSPGFTLVAAVDPTDRLVGVGYGHRGTSGQWWHDVVRQAVAAVHGAQTAATLLDDCFEVVELHVLPSHQGRGLGGRLLAELTAGRSEATTALSALDDDASRTSAARRLYAREGFRPVLERFQFPGVATPYAILARATPRLAPPTA